MSTSFYGSHFKPTFAGKGSTLKELLTVAECPSHPSESFTSDTREANPALSPLDRPTLTRTTDTCHTMVTREDRARENTEKHGLDDKLRQLYMGLLALLDGHHRVNPRVRHHCEHADRL